MALVEIVRLIIVLALTAAGYQQGPSLARAATGLSLETSRLVASVIGAGAGYVAGGVFGRTLLSGVGLIERRVDRTSGADLVTGAVGLLIGALGAVFVSLPILLFVPYRLLSYPAAVLLVVIFAYSGMRVALRKRFEMLAVLGLQAPRSFRPSHGQNPQSPKILDTSAIIDGRVADLAKSGFLTGHLICPAFVLAELHRIADSADPSRRGRGRRGLEVLEELQGVSHIGLEVTQEIIAHLEDVDDKLVEYARRVAGVLVTTDFNLHKTAELQGVKVLNLNSLAASLRPAVLPGDPLTVHIVREGTHPGQGVGHLEDGTMVVVEGASRLIGRDVQTTVASVLQTGAGRMVFCNVIGPASAASSE